MAFPSFFNVGTGKVMLQLTTGDVRLMKSCNPFITILLLVILGAACAPATEIPATPTPIIQTVEVTSEVTRLVNVPVTSTPTSTETLAYTYPSLFIPHVCTDRDLIIFGSMD
jgi:hypothetical protein